MLTPEQSHDGSVATAEEHRPCPQLKVPRRRNRKINSCLECRRRKHKCSRTYPCDSCQKSSRDCIFLAPKTTTNARTSRSSTSSGNFSTPNDAERRTESGETSCKGPTTVHALQPQSYDDEERSPTKDEKISDICLRIGKLSITERVGGILKSDLVQTLEAVLQQDPHHTPNQDSQDRFSAPIVAWFKPHSPLPFASLLSAGISASAEDMNLLSEAQYQLLFDQYFAAVDPIAHLIPRQLFCQENESRRSKPPSIAHRALRLAMCYAAAISMPLLQSQKLFGIAKDALVEKLKLATESCMSSANIFGKTDLETIQAVVIYLTPECRGEVSRSHSVFLGALIRHIQITGLGQTQRKADQTAIQLQMRRHLWQQLLFLDLRTAEAIGPEPTAMSTELDLELPRNADDETVLQSTSAFPSDTQEYGWSDSTLSLIRYECYKMHRLVFEERMRMRQGMITLSSILSNIDSKKLYVQHHYLNLLDEQIPVQRYASLVGKLLLARAEAMLLTSQTPKWRGLKPDLQLRDRVMRTCLDIVETAAILETDPELAIWAWYAGAYQQYHSIIFLLVELHRTPDNPYAERILVMADHIFGPSLTTNSKDRSGRILQALNDNLRSFLTARGISCPPKRKFSLQERQEETNLVLPRDLSAQIEEDIVWTDSGFLEDIQLLEASGFLDDEGLWYPWPLDRSDLNDHFGIGQGY